MKRKILSAGLALLIALSLLTTTVTAVLPGKTVYSNSRQITENLQYINSVSWDSTDGRGESFTLRYTQNGDAYPIVVKDETVYGSITVNEAITYAESMGKNVLAAVNSDFFSPQTGVPFGIFIEDGVYKSSPEGRTAVSFDSSGGVSLHSSPAVTITLQNLGGVNSVNAGKTVELSHFNKYRTDTGGIYMFSQGFSSVSTRTASNGWFVRFKILEGSPAVSGTMTLEVTDTLISDGAIEIGDGCLVLSAATVGGFNEEFEKFAVGDTVTLTTVCNDPQLVSARYATGSGEALVTNGARADVSGWDATMKQRSPRTALGIRADGTVVLYVIDGRDSTQSIGLTPDELIDEMLREGCVNAINLDGGGSSVMSLRLPGGSGCTVVNKPSDGKERKCATYILFVTDKTSDGRVQNLALSNDGTIVLAGSSIELNYTATDAGYRTVAAPGDVIASSFAYNTSIDGTLYTAGDMAGLDNLTLYSASTGARGSGSVYVITEPTSLTITRKGSTDKLSSVTLNPGQTLDLDLIATYYRRSVTAQAGSFTYTVTGDIGEITGSGQFTASLAPGRTGTLTVSAGGTSAALAIEVGGFTDTVGHWAQDYITHLASIGVVKGISDTEYGPELEIKRGDFVLMLYRAAGEPVTESTDGFDDVPSDSYYARAILWAKENGVAAGMGDGKFAPEAPLTRQQAFTFVYRCLGILNVPFADGEPDALGSFLDGDKVEDYAVIPTATLIILGVVQGSDGYLTPASSFTRAQMAKVLSVVLDSEGTIPGDIGLEGTPSGGNFSA